MSHVFSHALLSAHVVWCSPGLWYRQLWCKEWVWPGPRFALGLCSTQQQHNEDRSHFWVSRWLTCTQLHMVAHGHFEGSYLLLFYSASLAVVSWDYACYSAVMQLLWQCCVILVVLVTDLVLPTLAPTEKMSCLCCFRSWETPNPAWKYEVLFFFFAP